MTSTQHPDRLAAARRIFEADHPRLTIDRVAYDGDDVIIYFGGHGDHFHIDGPDIDRALAGEPGPSLVTRLRAHGLPAEPTPDGGATLTLTAIQALALVNALDRLEGLS